MRRRRDLPRVVSTRDACALYGFTPDAIAHAVASGRWRRIARGVLLTRDEPPTRDDWVLTGMTLTGPRAALSGWDAARIVGLGARNPPSERVLVLDRSGAHRALPGLTVRPTGRRYRTSMLPAEHPTMPYVPVVRPARAVADTALLYSTFAPVRALVTSAIQRNLCRPEELCAELEHSPRRGSRWLRRALNDVLAGAKSIAEAEAIELLTQARVPTFEANVPIVNAAGDLLAEADAVWRELRMILEVDSREFHFSERDWQATMQRHTWLTRRGFAVEHHAPSAVRVGRASWAGGVAHGLRARAAELGLTYRPGSGPLPVPPGGHRPIVLS